MRRRKVLRPEIIAREQVQTCFGELQSPLSFEPLKDAGWATVWDLNVAKRIYQTDEYGEFSIKAALKNIFDKKYSTNEDQWMPGASAYVGLAWNY